MGTVLNSVALWQSWKTIMEYRSVLLFIRKFRFIHWNQFQDRTHVKLSHPYLISYLPFLNAFYGCVKSFEKSGVGTQLMQFNLRRTFTVNKFAQINTPNQYNSLLTKSFKASLSLLIVFMYIKEINKHSLFPYPDTD